MPLGERSYFRRETAEHRRLAFVPSSAALSEGVLCGLPLDLAPLGLKKEISLEKACAGLEWRFGGHLRLKKCQSPRKENRFGKCRFETGCRGIRPRLRGRTQGDKPSRNADFRRFSLIFADSDHSRLFLENEAFGKRRSSQKTADFRRKPQKTAGTRRKPQISVCPLRFVPLRAQP